MPSLFYFQDLSHEEISEVTQLPIGTIKTHLFRARAMLQQRLQSAESGQYEIELHLRICAECGALLKTFKQVENRLRSVPFEQVSPNFTQRVMERLRIKESPSFLWSILKYLAPLLGLFIVICIVYGVMKFTGTLESSGVGESITTTQSAYSSVATKISTGVSAFNGLLKNLFQFLYAKTSYGLAALLIVLFIIVALLDRLVFMPLIRKKVSREIHC